MVYRLMKGGGGGGEGKRLQTFFAFTALCAYTVLCV